MLTKSKSSKFAKLKYLLLMILCVLLTAAFTKPIKEIPFNNSIEFLKTYAIPPSLFPVKNGSRHDITSHFEEKIKHPKSIRKGLHKGIDIRAKIGTPIVATADGIVAKASLEGNWGNLIVMTHADGYETWYAHLNGFNANKNQKVKKGDIIGYVGNTGLSTGPHLHYEVRQHGKPLDPINYIE